MDDTLKDILQYVCIWPPEGLKGWVAFIWEYVIVLPFVTRDSLETDKRFFRVWDIFTSWFKCSNKKQGK